MNMVVCRHPGDSGKYLFKMPEDVAIDAGTLVTVETKRGKQPAQCITSSFHADPTVICPLWNTTPEYMKKIISFLVQHDLEWPEEEIPFTDEPKWNEDEEP